MDTQTTRPAWLGAVSALALALVIGVVAGALHPQGAPAVPPATLSSPTPTLDAVITDSQPVPHASPAASTSVQAHPQATPSKDKESQ